MRDHEMEELLSRVNWEAVAAGLYTKDECWRCAGTGIWHGDYPGVRLQCNKCGGSGVYALHPVVSDIMRNRVQRQLEEANQCEDSS